jgi:hypothetical protein
MAEADSKSTTRRTVLAGIVAVTVSGETASGETPDPVFAAIERHRVALVAFVTAHGDDEIDAAGDIHHEALADLLETKPTTVAGCAAVLRYVEGLVHEGHGGIFHDCGLFDCWFEPVSRPGSAFLGLIADALVGLP